MNNEQFRRLVLSSGPSRTDKTGANQKETKKTATDDKDGGSNEETASKTPVGSGFGPGVLGSKMRSSIPMTPRAVTGTGVDFAKQLAEHRREQSQSQQRRFKSSSAPKGTKLPTGYQDRAQLRQGEREGGDKDEDEDNVEKGRDTSRARGEREVKGLDWELLRRAKAGEDVNEISSKRGGRDVEEEEEKDKDRAQNDKVGEEEDADEGDNIEDMDEEFDRVLEEKGKDVTTAPVSGEGEEEEKKKKKKKGTAPPPRRSRDEILRQLKASRAAAAAGGGNGGTQGQTPAPAGSTLGSKFKKVGDPKNDNRRRWVEQDEHGRRREVLLVTDGQGKTKRKVKWIDKPEVSNTNTNTNTNTKTNITPTGLLVPDKDAKPLGMDVPAELLRKETEPPREEDDDIFEGVGADYNPLGDIGTDDSSDESDEGEVGGGGPDTRQPIPQEEKAPTTTATDEHRPSRPRNYFGTSTTTESTDPPDRTNPLTKDPTILATLKRAAALRAASPSAETNDEQEPQNAAESSSRSKRFLEEVKRREAQDAMDMDLGFGESRVEDEEDEEPVVLEGEGERGGSKKRKRGPKKKKGDKDSASHVLRVMEGRKKKAL